MSETFPPQQPLPVNDVLRFNQAIESAIGMCEGDFVIAKVRAGEQCRKLILMQCIVDSYDSPDLNKHYAAKMHISGVLNRACYDPDSKCEVVPIIFPDDITIEGVVPINPQEQT